MPVGGDDRVARLVYEVAGAEERGAATQVGVHVAEATLHDVSGVEMRAQGVVTTSVDGELHGQPTQRIQSPGPLLVVLVEVGRAVRLGRIGQVGLVEEVFVTGDKRRENRERNPQLTLALEPVKVNQGRVEVGQVVAVGFDQRREVEPSTGERRAAPDPHRTDQIGRVTGGNLRG